MNTRQLAEHIVLGHYGRRQHRKARREADNLKQQADFTAPRFWVHAHINTRATDKPGTLAANVAHSRAEGGAALRDWQEHLTESRTAYAAGRTR